MTGVGGWIIGLSIALVAIAFIVLVIFLVFTLKELRLNLRQTERLIRHTTHIVEDVETKIHALDPIFHMVSGVGGAIQKQTASVKQLSEEVACSREREKCEKIKNTANTVLEVLEWAVIGVSLWQKIKEKEITMARNSQGKGFIVGTILGGVVGGLAALLLAPKSGAKLRKDISDKCCEASDKACDLFCDVSDQAKDLVEKAKCIAEDAKSAAQCFIKDMKNKK